MSQDSKRYNLKSRIHKDLLGLSTEVYSLFKEKRVFLTNNDEFEIAKF